MRPKEKVKLQVDVLFDVFDLDNYFLFMVILRTEWVLLYSIFRLFFFINKIWLFKNFGPLCRRLISSDSASAHFIHIF